MPFFLDFLHRPRSKRPETVGIMMVVTVAFFWGMFPIMVNKGSQHIQPLFFVSASTIIAAVTTTIISFLKKDLRNIVNKKGFFLGCLVALIISVFHYGLMFTGAKLTSGVNTAALALSEIIFALIFTPFFGEKPTVSKTFGGLLILMGSFTILFKGGDFNTGDLLIILSTTLLPFGSYFGKKALNYISSENLLTIRYAVGGIILFIVSWCIEDRSQMIPSVLNFWPYIAINGVLLLGFVNLLWYTGLKKMQISKAIFLLMTYPIFSLLFLATFYNEKPDFFQSIGVFIIVFGAYFTSKSDTSYLKFPAMPFQKIFRRFLILIALLGGSAK